MDVPYPKRRKALDSRPRGRRCLYQLFPAVISTLFMLLVYAVMRTSGQGPVFSALLAVIATVIAAVMNCTVLLYADVFMTLYALAGLYFISTYIDTRKGSHLMIGALLLGGAAWMKNEGMMVFVIAWGLLLITLCIAKQPPKRIAETAFAFVPAACIFIGPWRVFTAVFQIPVQDFSFFGGIETSYIMPVARRFFRELLMRPAESNLIWVMGAIAVTICLIKGPGKLRLNFLVLTAITITAAYGFIFLFSTINLSWHLRATYRIMILPRTIMLITAAIYLREIFLTHQKNSDCHRC